MITNNICEEASAEYSVSWGKYMKVEITETEYYAIIPILPFFRFKDRVEYQFSATLLN
jgi:hypothetical protein